MKQKIINAILIILSIIAIVYSTQSVLKNFDVIGDLMTGLIPDLIAGVILWVIIVWPLSIFFHRIINGRMVAAIFTGGAVTLIIHAVSFIKDGYMDPFAPLTFIGGFIFGTIFSYFVGNVKKVEN